MPMTEAEKDFLDEYTRRLLVRWADRSLRTGSVGDIQEEDEPYFSYAIDKGWIGKASPRRLTAKGFSVAASFLRR
jgi:hypothetical protein